MLQVERQIIKGEVGSWRSRFIVAVASLEQRRGTDHVTIFWTACIRETVEVMMVVFVWFVIITDSLKLQSH